MSGRGRASRAKRRGSRVWGKVFPGSKTRQCEEQEAECKRQTEVQRIEEGESWDKESGEGFENTGRIQGSPWKEKVANMTVYGGEVPMCSSARWESPH